jgi:hemicentin
VQVRGVPVPQVTWFKDGEPLVTAKYVTECTERGRCTLTIVDATNEDAGRYACEAVNVCGRVNTLTVVEVMANRRMVEAEQKLQGYVPDET